MAHGPSGPKYALEGVMDRYPTTPFQARRRESPGLDGKGPPLVDIGPGGGTTLQQLQQDQDLVRRVVELLPAGEVRAAVQAFAHQAGALTEALGGREMVSAVLHQLDGALSREETALLHSELEHELGGPLDDSSETSWIEREAEHARWELARHWIALVLAAVRRHGAISFDARLRPIQPDGPKDEWSASPEEVEEALLASVALKRDGLDSLMKLLHGNLAEAVASRGPLELPGRVTISRQADGLLQARPP